MGEVSTIGVDIAKLVFHIHGVNADGAVVIRKRVCRARVLDFFADLPPCRVGMEACATAHQWARELKKLGHDTRLMAPSYVKAYVKRGKNDAADAAADLRGRHTAIDAVCADQDHRAAEHADAAPRAGSLDPPADPADERTSCPPCRTRVGGSEGA